MSRSVKVRQCNQPGCTRTVKDRFKCAMGRGCRKGIVAATPVVPPSAPPVAPTRKKNYIIYLLDNSPSMALCIDRARRWFNDVVATMKVAAYSVRNEQDTYVSVYTIGDYPYKLHANTVHPERTPIMDASNLNARGNGTPLFLTMNAAINNALQLHDANDPNVSFLLSIVTDGEDNVDTWNYSQLVKGLLKKANATDRWSVVFAGPPGSKSMVTQHLGLYGGNCTEWDVTEASMAAVSKASVVGTQAYFASRSAGDTQIKTFYEADLSKVQMADLAKLANWNTRFMRFPVTQKMEISDFVASLGLPTGYRPGNGYFELSKRERVQSHKEFAILLLRSGQIYGGAEARKIMGLPAGQDIKLAPGVHKLADGTECKVFVQSTSVNRHLMPGTEMLYLR